ncbi:hypothetical protein ADL25_13280 [Streptomyces sp. NRRL F-5122]|nr:hypothetical protein ADL25_13280 [Streptomyces sp. NRRL F-5122]
MRVQGAQLVRLGLHLTDRRRHTAVDRGQDVHGVVAGVQEDAPPQIAHLVGMALLDADEAAARPDALQFPVGDGVPGVGGQHRQDRQGEQRLERARGRQCAVRVVRGEHLARRGVADHPGQRRHIRQRGGP